MTLSASGIIASKGNFQKLQESYAILYRHFLSLSVFSLTLASFLSLLGKDCGDKGMRTMGKKNKDCYETTYDEDGNPQGNERDYYEIDENGLKDQGFNDFELDQLQDTLKACKDKGGYSETICEDRWSMRPPVK